MEGLAGGWLREEKKRKMVAAAWFWSREKKLGLCFFVVALNFYYGWRFTYIKNLYTCYSRK